MVTPKASYQDFLDTLNEDELADLSNLHLPGSEEIDPTKIEKALSQAASDWLSWFGFSDYNNTGIPQECLGSAVSCEIAIARKKLDFNNPREAVVNDVNFCYQIARDWKSDRLKAGTDIGDISGEETVMSAFSI